MLFQFGLVASCTVFVAQARQESRSAPVLNTEDIWEAVQGPTSLVEMAVDQKDVNSELVEHHYSLGVILHAVFAFNMRGVKPLSFFDTKVSDRQGFFCVIRVPTI